MRFCVPRVERYPRHWGALHSEVPRLSSSQLGLCIIRRDLWSAHSDDRSVLGRHGRVSRMVVLRDTHSQRLLFGDAAAPCESLDCGHQVRAARGVVTGDTDGCTVDGVLKGHLGAKRTAQCAEHSIDHLQLLHKQR